MPRLSNSASAAVAALVVAVAAAVTSLGSGPEPEASPSAVVPSGARGAISVMAESPTGRPVGVAPSVDHAVLFVGRSPDLKPRGGVARSFACRAAASLAWTCLVHADVTRPVSPSISVDVLVLVLVPRDDASRVARLLDGLPAGVAGARLVILEPIAAGTEEATTRRLAGIRRLAAARGAVVVDPVAEGWLSARTRRTYLTPDGTQLSAAGHDHAGTLLATVLRDVDHG